MPDSEAPRKESEDQKRDRLGKFVGGAEDFRIVPKGEPEKKK